MRFQKDADNPGAAGPDTEGITVDANGLIYVASERDNSAKGVNQNKVLQVDPDLPGPDLVALEDNGGVYAFALAADGSAQLVATLDPGLPGVMSLDYDSVLGVLPAVVDNGGGAGRGSDNGGDSGAGDTSAADSDAKDGNALAATGSEAHIAFLVLALGLLLTGAFVASRRRRQQS